MGVSHSVNARVLIKPPVNPEVQFLIFPPSNLGLYIKRVPLRECCHDHSMIMFNGSKIDLIKHTLVQPSRTPESIGRHWSEANSDMPNQRKPSILTQTCRQNFFKQRSCMICTYPRRVRWQNHMRLYASDKVLINYVI
jgi:hypothetical protein